VLNPAMGCRNRVAGYPGTRSGSLSGIRVLDGDLDIFEYPPGSTRVGYWGGGTLVPFDSTRQASGVIMTKIYNIVDAKTVHFSLPKPALFVCQWDLQPLNIYFGYAG